MMTNKGLDISNAMVVNRLNGLISQFFKILPIKESGDKTLKKYMMSLQREMLGYQSLIVAIHDDDRYMSLLAILEYMITHVDDPELDVATVRSDVFKSINILNKLRDQYGSAEVRCE